MPWGCMRAHVTVAAKKLMATFEPRKPKPPKTNLSSFLVPSPGASIGLGFKAFRV